MIKLQEQEIAFLKSIIGWGISCCSSDHLIIYPSNATSLGRTIMLGLGYKNKYVPALFKADFFENRDGDTFYDYTIAAYEIEPPAYTNATLMLQSSPIQKIIFKSSLRCIVSIMNLATIIEQRETNNQWDENLIALLEQKAHAEETVDNYIHLLFICWYLVLEKGCVKHDIDDNLLIAKLRDNYNRAKTLFENDSCFMFYTGWMFNIAFWYFGNEYDGKGDQLIALANQKSPDNALYKWAYIINLNGNAEYAKKLAADVHDSEFEGLGYTVKTYFKEMIGA